MPNDIDLKLRISQDGAEATAEHLGPLKKGGRRDRRRRQGEHRLANNMILNPNGKYDQRGVVSAAAALNDGVFAWDRWVILSEQNSVITPKIATPTRSDCPGTVEVLQLYWSIADKQAGIVQYIENAQSIGALVHGKVSFGFRARSTGVAQIRACLLGWAGTANAITIDPVQTWNSVGAEPTWKTNFARIGGILDCSLTTSFQSFALEGITLSDSSVNNLALIVWSDDATISTTSTVDIYAACLCLGSTVVFTPLTSTAEVAALRLYYESINKGNIFTNTAFAHIASSLDIYSSTNGNIFLIRPRFIKTPTVTKFGSGDIFIKNYAGVGYAVTLGSVIQTTSSSGTIQIAFTGSGMTQTAGGICFVNNSATTGIELNGEIAS